MSLSNSTVPTRYVISHFNSLLCSSDRIISNVRCVTLSIFQVLVIIDVKPKDLGLPTEAYISVEEIHDVSYL